jgi:hypothetical protein
MKKLTFILILLLVSINAVAREYFEKGDALYRAKGTDPSFGHAGIYWYWNTNFDPLDRESHWEIESSTEIGNGGVQKETFRYFYWQTSFWSVRSMTFLHRLKYFQRELIVETAKPFLDIDTEYSAYAGYKNPNGTPPTFRCDGLVEYCYEIALGHPWIPGLNGGIVLNDTYLVPSPPLMQTLYPWFQMVHLDERTYAELEEVKIEYPKEGETITGFITLLVFASDGLYGSGTAKVDFWIDDNLIGKDIHQANPSDSYSWDWDSKTVVDGEHNLRVRGYDQAGNFADEEVTFFVNNTLPIVVSTSPANGVSNVDVYSDITITFNKEMDQSTVNSGTILFNPPLHGGFTTEWSGDEKTVTLTLTNPQEDLKFYADYNIIVTDGVMDIEGTRLDGDRDGEPGGNSETQNGQFLTFFS